MDNPENNACFTKYGIKMCFKSLELFVKTLGDPLYGFYLAVDAV